MNVDRYFDQIEIKPLTKQTLFKMFTDRRVVYQGFAALEAHRGFLEKQASLSTSRGQEQFKLLLFRVLEEVAESIEAEEPVHKKEEIIDAFNYLLSAYQLDPTVVTDVELVNWFFEETVKKHLGEDKVYPLRMYDLGLLSYHLTGMMGDVLRNRPWMNNAQHTQFEGKELLHQIFQVVVSAFLGSFKNWDEFYLYYEAKNLVLKFRLDTNY